MYNFCIVENLFSQTGTERTVDSKSMRLLSIIDISDNSNTSNQLGCVKIDVIVVMFFNMITI